jgi:hypothetical protein
MTCDTVTPRIAYLASAMGVSVAEYLGHTARGERRCTLCERWLDAGHFHKGWCGNRRRRCVACERTRKVLRTRARTRRPGKSRCRACHGLYPAGQGVNYCPKCLPGLEAFRRAMEDMMTGECPTPHPEREERLRRYEAMAARGRDLFAGQEGDR